MSNDWLMIEELAAPPKESLQSLVANKLNGFIDNLANKLAADPASGTTPGVWGRQG